jgi:hypothetical protein
MISVVALAVVLQLANVAPATRVEIDGAKQEVVRLYRSVDIDVSWTNDEPRPAPDATVIRVVVVPSATGYLRTSQKVVMGAAVRAPQGSNVAYIFYRQVQKQADRHNAAMALVLACAIAHEVGHLLMPGHPHAALGLMRASWDHEDFRRATQGQLRFLPEDVAELRASAVR